MTDNGDKRLIEEFIPIDSISAESSVENSVTQAKGHLSKALVATLHRWWARRPLTACRAAIYGALVPAPTDQKEMKRETMFVEELCKWKAPKTFFEKASKKILKANGGRAPKVLDLFAGGGSIPLEAARLGCESHAVELNPVAHLVELATLVYPPKYGKKLLEEVEHWSHVAFERAREDVGDLYPKMKETGIESCDHLQKRLDGMLEADANYCLTPTAYLWTRTVPCPRPDCGAQVPLHRQTWLRKKAGGYYALRPVPIKKDKMLSYELLHSTAKDAKTAIEEWGFNPSNISSRGETTCPFCTAPIPTQRVKEAGREGKMGVKPMAVVCVREGVRGKVYLPGDSSIIPNETQLKRRLDDLLKETALTLPTEPLRLWSGVINPPIYGFDKMYLLFTDRQLLTLFTFIKHIRAAHREMVEGGMDAGLARAVATYLAFIVDKVAERGANVCRWHNGRETIESPIANGKMPMVWDFPEVNPFGGASGSLQQSEKDVIAVLNDLVSDNFNEVKVKRESALSLSYDQGYFDAVITDPPYYFNVPYSYIADFFYVTVVLQIKLENVV